MRLANNLLNLADLCQTHRAVIEGDRVNYRATDADEAGRVASAIVTSLADTYTGGADVWGDRCARVWTLLSDCYEQVQAVGHYLLRATPGAARERFPSLVAGSRATPSRKDATPAQPAADPQPAPPAEPATPRRRHAEAQATHPLTGPRDDDPWSSPTSRARVGGCTPAG